VRAPLALAVVLLVTACGGGDNGSPTEPQPLTLTGTWAGTIVDSVGGHGTVRATVRQDGNQVTGTWAATFTDPRGNNGGSLSGTVNGSAVSLTLYGPNEGVCPFRVTATWSGDRLTGTYAAFSCTTAITGSLDLRRQ